MICSRWIFALCLALTILTGNTVAEKSKRPNIVFIFSDDHAVQAISAYGSKINQTPNIDRIAREGAIFRNSFCANSICGPSRACILTGKHSHLNGFLRNGNRFDGTQTTFPPLLQKAGYQTALVGKWHLGTDPVGFDYYEILPGQGSYYNPDFIQMDGSKKRYTGYCTDIITEKSLHWLQEQRDPEEPFMLMCQHKAPHRNWSPPKRHFQLYEAGVPEPETLFDDYSNRSDLLQENEMSIKDHFHWGHDMKFNGPPQFPKYFAGRHGNGEYRRMTPEQKADWNAYYGPRNEAFLKKLKNNELTDKQVIQWKYQRYISDYLKCIAAVDDGVGRILEYLDSSGLAENTIVIYSSDQGFYLGEHGWYDKRWMFEESLKMPFVIRWPKVVQPGRSPNQLIQNIDYGPTFLDVAGIDIPEEMQGRSLVPVLQNRGESDLEWRDAIYYAYYENAAVHAVPIHDGVRTDRYKLMFFPRKRQWQLFDLVVDPQEMRSLHDTTEYRQILTALQKRYVDIRRFYGVNTAAIPMTRGDEEWWANRDRAVREKSAEGPYDLMFIGDSITQGWEGAGKKIWAKYYQGRNAINFGFSGDRTEHTIWRLNHTNFQKVAPKVAVVMIGTNNTGHQLQEPQQVAEGIGKIIEILNEKSPDTKIVLMGVFPRGKSRFDEKRLNNVAINQIIRRYSQHPKVDYLDISHVFLSDDQQLTKEIMPDYLHLSPEAYKRWAEAIEPKLKELGV